MPSKLAVIRASLLGVFLFLGTVVFAQRSITGKVTDESGQGVQGATVQVKGTNIATVSDVSGNFTINSVNPGSVLIISFVGFQQKEITVGNQTSVSVSLSPSLSNLNEVVVTGYTAQRKKDITGSVAVVDVKAMKNVPAGNPENMLQGQAAGVNVISSGLPGGGSNVFIRGITSFGDVNPLVIVDGIQSSLHDINPNDIESIQVLKDAGAASIYGVRGANGVIVVTTKKGKAGRAIVTYDGFYGTQRPLKGNVFNLANSEEMAALTYRVQPNTTLYPGGRMPDYLIGIGSNFSNPGQYVGYEGDAIADPANYVFDKNPRNQYLIARANKEGTDWYHEVFKPAPMQSHNITASGGSDRSLYMFSLGYFDQQGTLIESYLKRYSVRANTQFNIKNKIRVGENAYIFYKDNPTFGLQEENIINHMYRQQVILPVRTINGHYAGNFMGPETGNANNPVATRERGGTNKYNTWNITGNVFAEVDLLRHFVVRTSFGGTLDNQYGYNFIYNTYENKESHESNTGFSEYSQFNSNWTWTNTIAYNNVFADKHDVKVIAGTEAIEWKGRGLSAGRTGYFTADPNYWILDNGTSNQTNSSYGYNDALFSLFGRLDYGFADKYLFSATIRRDGSSKFGPNSRYGVFPSFSAAWRISSEEFMSSVSWITELKLRGGWGKLGSQQNVNGANAFNLFGGTNRNAYYDIGGTSTSPVQGFRQTQIGNLNTSWEENVVTNVGLDGALFNNKLDFGIEWYKKSIDGLLFQDQAGVIGVGGATLPVVNIGNVENTGIDFNLGYRGSFNREWNFSVGLNVGAYKSEIISIPGSGYFDAGGVRQGNFVRNQMGHPISSFFGYEVIGLFRDEDEVSKAPAQDAAAPGRFRYRDVSGDNRINEDDRTFFGNPNPDFTYGINLSVAYKSFDLAAVFYGSQGNDVINYVKYWTDFMQSFAGAKSKDLANNSWTPSNPNAKVPKAEADGNFSNNGVINSYYLEDGSFFKCRSLILGYNVDQSLMRRIGVDRLRVYVQAANLFQITKYSGQDPELTGGSAAFGIDYGNYPNNQKSYLVGVNLSF